MTENRPDIEIRPFEPGDAARVSEVIRRCLSEVNAADLDPEDLRLWSRDTDPAGILARSRATTCVIAETAEGVVAGYAGLCGDRIVNVFVDPGLHRRGIGRALVSRLEGIAMERGLRSLRLLSSRAAIPFYERLGYLPVRGVRSGMVGMRKEL